MVLEADIQVLEAEMLVLEVDTQVLDVYILVLEAGKLVEVLDIQAVDKLVEVLDIQALDKFVEEPEKLVTVVDTAVEVVAAELMDTWKIGQAFDFESFLKKKNLVSPTGFEPVLLP